MTELIDVTNSKHLQYARHSKEISNAFKKIDELILMAAIKKITLGSKLFNDIIKQFPTEMRPYMLEGFEYKESTIVPLKC